MPLDEDPTIDTPPKDYNPGGVSNPYEAAETLFGDGETASTEQGAQDVASQVDTFSDYGGDSDSDGSGGGSDDAGLGGEDM